MADLGEQDMGFTCCEGDCGVRVQGGTQRGFKAQERRDRDAVEPRLHGCHVTHVCDDDERDAKVDVGCSGRSTLLISGTNNTGTTYLLASDIYHVFGEAGGWAAIAGLEMSGNETEYSK